MLGELQLRVTLLGDGAVGKTSLRRQFMGKGFSSSHQMTIGADFAVLKKEIEDFNVTYQIWDLAGQQSFQSVRSRFFMGALGGLCVFDLTRKSSFNNISKWIEELWRNNGKGVVPIILIGNKSDLKGSREVKRKDAEKFTKALNTKTKKHGFNVSYVETSAKEGENVDLAFEILAKEIIRKMFEVKI